MKSDLVDLPKGGVAEAKKKKDEEEVLFKKEEKKLVKKEEPKEEIQPVKAEIPVVEEKEEDEWAAVPAFLRRSKLK